MTAILPIPFSRKELVLVTACAAAFGLGLAWARTCDGFGVAIAWCICVALWTVAIAIVRTRFRIFYSSLFGILFCILFVCESLLEKPIYFDWSSLLMVIIFYVLLPAAVGLVVTKLRNDERRIS